MINELQRQAYLSAIGVDCYMPRLLLPGAKPSIRCELPLPTSAANVRGGANVEVTEVQPVRSATSGAAAIQDLLNDTVVSRRAGLAPAGESLGDANPVGGDNAKAPKSVPRFKLSIVRAGNLLLVDDGLTGDIDPQSYLRLIHNILQAAGANQAPLSIDAFIWPLQGVRGAHVDQSEIAARETLLAYLSKQQEHTGADYLLLLGDTACRYLLTTNPTHSGESPVQLAPHDHLPLRYLVTCSAAQSMLNPALKSRIWQDLQPLRRILVRH